MRTEELEIRGRPQHSKDQQEYLEESWRIEQTGCHSESREKLQLLRCEKLAKSKNAMFKST